MTRAESPLEEIRRLYFNTTKQSIGRDLDRAIDLLKGMSSDDERERAAVFMDGLAQLRSEWGVKTAAPKAPAGPPGRPQSTTPATRPAPRRRPT